METALSPLRQPWGAGRSPRAAERQLILIPSDVVRSRARLDTYRPLLYPDGDISDNVVSQGQGGRVQPSIKDVARRSGVSYKTVSRVINGEPNVSSSTRTRVEAAVVELGYRPDHTARSLRRGRTQTLRLLVVRRFERFLTEPFLDEVVSGIVDSAARAGYALMLEVAGPSDTKGLRR